MAYEGHWSLSSHRVEGMQKIAAGAASIRCSCLLENFT